MVCFDWPSIHGHLKNKNARIQKLTGFIALTKIQVVKVFDFNLFVASRGTRVEPSPTIVVESLYITFWDAF